MSYHLTTSLFGRLSQTLIACHLVLGESFLLLLLDIHHVVFVKDFGCAPQHGIFLCGNFMKVNSSGLLGMGPARQSPMDTSDASFTLPGRVLASSPFCSKLSITVVEREREDSGHVAGLMGTDVSVDVFERQTERGRVTVHKVM